MPEPGWAFYAAAVFNDHNPWWGVMPDVTAYLRRVSFLMRQGTPQADIAIYLPQDDALAEMKPGQATIDGAIHHALRRVINPFLVPSAVAGLRPLMEQCTTWFIDQRIEHGSNRQEELAARAGVHRTYVGMIERAEKRISVVTLFRVARALDVPAARLLEGIE